MAPTAAQETPSAATGHPAAPTRRHHRRATGGEPSPEEQPIPQELPGGLEQAGDANPLPTMFSFAASDLEKLYESEASIAPQAHPELVNDLDEARHNLLPPQTPPEDKLFLSPQNELPDAQPARPLEEELYK